MSKSILYLLSRIQFETCIFVFKLSKLQVSLFLNCIYLFLQKNAHSQDKLITGKYGLWIGAVKARVRHLMSLVYP